MDMKMEDRRATPRFRVQFCAALSGPARFGGTGSVLDLSLGGCRLETPLTLEPGLLLELRISVPGLEWPLKIDEASVQSVKGQSMGLAFVRIRQIEQQRLDEVVAKLSAHTE